VVPDPPEDEAPHPRFPQDVVDECPVLWREFHQRQGSLLGNGELGRYRRGKVLLQGVGIEGLRGHGRRHGRWLQLQGGPREGGQWQPELISDLTTTVGPLFALAAFERPVPMERNRP
jgi:hypothetical protein